MPKPYLCAFPIHLALFAALLCTMPVNIFGAPKFNRLASFNPNSLRKCPCGRDVLDYMDDYYLNSNYKRSTNSFDGGTQGTIYHGYHKKLKKCVAIKIMNFEGKSDYTKNNFLMEYYTSKVLKMFAEFDPEVQKRIVNFYDLYKDSSKIVIFMELGASTAENFWSKVAKNGNYSYAAKVALAKTMMSKLVKCFITLHSIGIMHLDFKLSNAIVVFNNQSSGDYALKLIDFGAARTAKSNKSEDGINAQVRNIFAMMTPVTAAPEQLTARYDKELDVLYVEPTTKSDIWAIGSNLFFMFTDHFTGDFFTDEEANEASMIKMAHWLSKWKVINDDTLPLFHMALACLHVTPKKRPMAFQLIAYLSNWCTMGISSIYTEFLGLKPRSYDGSYVRTLCITMTVDQYHQKIKGLNKSDSLLQNVKPAFKRIFSFK